MQPQSFVSALRRFDVFGRSYWGGAQGMGLDAALDGYIPVSG